MRNFNRDDRSRSRRDFGRRDFGRRNFDDYGGERATYHAVCSNCGRDCEVPFEPTGSKPVYCNECFKKMGNRGDSRRFQDRRFPDRNQRRPFFERRQETRPQNNQQFEVINRKLDKILGMLTTTTPAKVEKEIMVKPKEIPIIAKKKPKTSKKKTPITKSI